jgi:4-diphosphocytidyl-2-C-methyl-D-erythritol kinase
MPDPPQHPVQARPRTQPLPDDGFRLHAPAKINLNLLVGPVRPDGFHPLDSYVLKVTLYDQLDIHPRRDGQITLTCEGFDCGEIEGNLALRAARRLAEESTVAVGGAAIHLVKNIPPGAGLGGGSSDAAAVLRALAGLWEMDPAGDQLSGLAAELGSDVPLFLAGPAARITGRGERIADVQLPPLSALIYLPEESCSTADVYRQFDRHTPTDLVTRQLAPEELAAAPPSAWRGRLVNDLAAAASAVCPAVGRQMRRLRQCVDIPVCLTGSGSAMFVLCDDQAEVSRVWHAIDADMKPRCRIVCGNPW